MLTTFLIVFSILPIAAAAVGLTRAFDDPASALCAVFAISTLLVHLPMWIEYRYWLPMLPYELALAAAGAHFVLRRSHRAASSAG